VTIRDQHGQNSNSMKKITLTGVRLIVSGWAVFLVGLLSLLWLHAFDKAHLSIFPLTMFLWILLLSCVWEGSKVASQPVSRVVSFLAQAGLSTLVVLLFFFQLASHVL
jgi:hypothetical protein